MPPPWRSILIFGNFSGDVALRVVATTARESDMTRTFISLSKMLFALGLMTSGAVAGTTTVETWATTQPGGNPCILTVTLPATTAANGSVSAGSRCKGALKKVDTIAYVGGKKRDIILQDTSGSTRTLVTLRRKKNKLVGTQSGGAKLTFALTTTVTTTSSVAVTSGSGTGTKQKCLSYVGNNRCVRATDARNPLIPAFQTIEMKFLTRQNIFPFSGGSGFAKDEKAKKGSCYKVKKCERAFNSTEDWCEIVLSDGFFTGWVKRADANTVYMRSGC